MRRHAKAQSAGSTHGIGTARCLLSLLVVVAAFLAIVPSAFAAKGVVTSFGATGTTGGAFSATTGVGGVAVNNASGNVYAVDRGNHRIQQFSAGGSFIRAWGQDVDTAAGTGFEICTVAANCKTGITTASTGGAMSTPQGIAVDQATGNVYVTDQAFLRVDEFTSSGAFLRSFGQDVVSSGPGNATATSAKQTLTVDATGGTFTLTFRGKTTSALPWNISAAELKAALEALSTVGPSSVTTSGGPGATAPLVVTFAGGFANTPLPTISSDATNLSGGAQTAAVVNTATGATGFEACVAANGDICKTGVAGGTAGAFAATFSGYLAVNPSNSNVVVADSGNRRIQEFTSSGAFVRAFGSDVVAIGPDNSGTTNEVQNVKIAASSGTFTLSLSAQTTSPLPYNASASQVESALNALSTIGGVGGRVTVTGGPGDQSGSTPYVLSFGGALQGTNVPQVVVSGVGLGIPVGTQLSCSTNVTATTISYQWLRSGAPIAGATSAIYTTAAADEGKPVQCQVFTINANAGATKTSTPTLVSPAPVTLPPSPPANVAAPTITTGTLTVGGAGGATLTCVPGTWTGAPTFAFQWYLNGVPLSGNGANTNVYTVQTADLALAGAFQCAVTGTNASGAATAISANRLTTAAPGPVAAPNPTAILNLPAPLATASTTTEGVSGYEICTATSLDACKTGLAGTAPGTFASAGPTRVVVDGSSSIYATDSGNFRVQKFTPSVTVASNYATSTVSGTSTFDAPTDLAVDSISDNLYVVKPTGATGERQILQFDNSGNLLDRHAVGSGIVSSNGLGVVPPAGAGAGNLYLTTPTGVDGAQQVLVLNSPSVPPVATIDPGAGFMVDATSATLTGKVNPQGFATGWHFEYSTDGSTWTKVPVSDAMLGFADGSDHSVSQAIPGLLPNTTYSVRLVATKVFGGGTSTSAPTIFTTLAQAPIISATGVDSIQNTSVRLVGFINPRSQEATYHFEYGSNGDCASNPCASVPVPDASAGSGFTPRFVLQDVTGLQPGATYHFRLVATNATGTSSGPDGTFSTRLQPLPADDRAYELVTPYDKPGGIGVGQYDSGAGGEIGVVTGTSSTNGERFISTSYAGHLSNGGFLYLTDVAHSERTGHGWETHSPFTHGDYSAQGGALTALFPESATDDLSQLSYAANGALLFPGMSGWSLTTQPYYAVDWQGKWEAIAPLAPGQGKSEKTTVAANAQRTLVVGTNSGLLGPEDASRDLPAGNTKVYSHDIVGGPSDTFPGAGSTSLVGICTGSGADRTQIPSRDAGGKQGAQDCPAPLPGRNQALVSKRSISVGISGPLTNALSADGSRAIFNAPNPGESGSPAICAATVGAATDCPSQLYIEERDESGAPTTRWISRSQVPNQDASLMSKVLYDGASRSGSTVFFHTNAPLTADDPNGTGSSPVTTGSASAISWDLYEYDLPPGGDPGAGTLTRISAGPLGNADPNVLLNGLGSGLRFVSSDGSRLLFTSQAPIPGVPTNGSPTNGTTTTAGGTATDANSTNLYYYDANKPLTQRWEFVARLPKNTETGKCATLSSKPGESYGYNGGGANFNWAAGGETSCVRGVADGTFITFLTPASLVTGDSEATSMDLYGFDAATDRLIRLSAPQGGDATPYACVGSVSSPTGTCYVDSGFTGSFRPLAGVATHPREAGDRIAYFQSKSRLVAADTNSQYDVYEWRNGRLSLVSTGTAGTGAFYSGNSADGRDIFIETRSKLSWEDIDGVMDIYDARVGGGFQPPPSETTCAVLSDLCQALPTQPPSVPSVGSAALSGQGNQRGTSVKPLNCKKGQKKITKHGKSRCVKRRHAKQSKHSGQRGSK